MSAWSIKGSFTMSVFEIAGHTLDLQRGRLRKGDADVALRPKSFSLLAYFVQNRGRVIGKEELIGAIWPNVAVTDDSLTQCLNDVRVALGVQAQGLIRTLPRRGYLMDDTRVARTALEAFEPADAAAIEKPSVAVIPFRSLTDLPGQGFFAQGIADDLVSALTKIGDLSVIAAHGPVLATASAPSQIAARLGVRYLVEGTVRIAGPSMRVSVHVVDGRSGQHVWADRYDAPLDAVFAVQDEITRSIALALQVELTQGESARLWEGQTKDLRAWERMVKARLALQRYTTADNSIAQRLLREAIAIDPLCTGALLMLGICHYWDSRFSIDLQPQASLEELERCADRLAEIDPGFGATYTLRASAAFLRRRHEEAIVLAGHAAELSPSDNRVLGFLGLFCTLGGQEARALAVLAAARRQSPFPEAWIVYYTAIAHYWLGNAEGAVQEGEAYARLYPDEAYGQAYLVAIYQRSGRKDEAARLVQRLNSHHPGFGAVNLRRSEIYRDVGRVEQLIELLAKAGWTPRQ